MQELIEHPPEPLKSSLMRRHHVLAAILSMVVCGGVSATCVWWAGTRPTVTVQDVRELDGVAVRGGAIDLVAHIKRSRVCETHVDRWLWRETEVNGEKMRQWVPLPGPDAPPSPVGTDVKYIVSLAIPANISPGQWYYYSRAHDSCGWMPGVLSSPMRESPNVPVTIEAASDAVPVIVPQGPVELIPAK